MPTRWKSECLGGGGSGVGGGWEEVSRREGILGARCPCPNRWKFKLLRHILFYGGYPDCCYEIQVRFMIFFILNMICYANAACDSLIKSICYHEAKRGRWDLGLRAELGKLVALSFAIILYAATRRGAPGVRRISSGRPHPFPHPHTPAARSDPLPKWASQ